MNLIIHTIYALIGIAGATWGLLYYQGKLNYAGEKEERRKDRVKKYGTLLLASVIFTYFGAALLLFGNILHIFE